MTFAVPPISKQKAIVVYVIETTRSMDKTLAAAKHEIDLIREHRTRLVADVVTGKVDVRGLAPAEPPPSEEQIDEGVDNEEMLGDGEPELVEEVER